MKWNYQADCIKIEVPLKRNSSWSQTFLLTSDIHIDSPKCEVGMLKRHIKQLEEKDAYLIDNGDLFDCMGGKYDKRSNKADILPKLQVANYFDKLIDHAHDILEPAARRTIMLSDGNHELSVLGRHEVDLIGNIQKSLNSSNKKANILRQGYVGWLKFCFRADNGSGDSLVMYRTHGNGGAAPVSKGVSQTARRQDMIDADLYLSGHIHTNFTLPRPVMKLSDQGVVYTRERIHHQIGTYKDSTWCTWENMKGFAPPSLGGSWLTFRWNNESNRVCCEITRAI
jgi:hypothetical protein